MGDLRLGSQIGGNLIWHAGILRLKPADTTLHYKEFEVITSKGNQTIDGTLTVKSTVTVPSMTSTGTVAAPTFVGNLTGKLTTPRTLTIGNTGKSFDGSANVAWSVAEIGALNLTGGTLTGVLKVGAEIQTTSENSYRHVTGNYGTFWRQDGTNVYFMLTASGDQYGSYNSLRPFSVALATGNVNMGHSVSVGGNLSVTGTTTSTGNITAPNFIGNLTGKLNTPRTFTVGNTGKSFDASANVAWTLAEIGAAPLGYGLGEQQPVTVADANSDPLTWLPNGGQGWVRFITSTTNKPDSGTGAGVLLRYQSGTTSSMWLHYISSTGTDFTRYWNGTAWGAWNTQYTSANLPKSTGTAPITVNQTTGAIGITGATTSAAGSMSAADKIRLDAIGTNSIVHTGGGQTINGSLATSGALTVDSNLTVLGDSTLTGVLTASGGITGSVTGDLTGNASTATTLQTARTINGTSFNGSADITTANWGTARTLTIGNTGKSVNGSANVTWSLAEIGALPLTGGTVSGATIFANDLSFTTGGRIRYTGFNTGNTQILNGGTSNTAILGNPTLSSVQLEVASSGTAKVLKGSTAYDIVTTQGGQTIGGGITTTGVTTSGITVNGTAQLGFSMRNWGTTGRESVFECNFVGAPYMFYAQRTADGTQSMAVNGSLSANSITSGGTVTAPTFVGALTGNASTASTLQTARNLTIGNTGKSFDGSANVSWTLAEIGALPAADVFQLSGTGSWAALAGKVPRIGTDGVLEVGRYIDFHTNDSTADYDVRMDCTTGAMTVTGDWTFQGRVNATGSIACQYNSSTEPQIRIDRENRQTYIYDSGNTVGLYSIGTGLTSTHLIHRSLATGDVVVGSGAGVTQIRGTSGIQCNNHITTNAGIRAVSTGNSYGSNAIEIYGNGSGILPTIGFHQPGVCSGIIQLQNNGEFWFKTDHSGGWSQITCGRVYSTGNVEANDVYIRSDRRLKSNFTNVESPLDKVCSLSGMYYDKKSTLTAETTSREFGIIAQDLEKVLPEGVNKSSDDDEILSVSNSAVNALLVEAIKELRAEVDSLKAELNAVKGL